MPSAIRTSHRDIALSLVPSDIRRPVTDTCASVILSIVAVITAITSSR